MEYDPEVFGSEFKLLGTNMPPIVARLQRPLASVTMQLGTIGSDSRGYLDPGSGSYLFQVAMAGLLGAAFAVKSNWERIKAAIRTKLSRRK